MNYKVKGGSEAESKEAQCLFFELGYRWLGGHGSSYFKINDNFKYITAYMRGMSLAQGTNGDAKKEITMLQLRDMVVLKRNDVADATHKCIYDNIPEYFIASDGALYFYKNTDWVRTKNAKLWCDTHLKPITKEPVMKEFLNPDQGYKLVCCAIGETPIPENWIEVPQGATSYNQYTKGESDNEFFIKLVGDTYLFANEDNGYMWEWYGGSLKGHEFVLWQRETLNDKVASAEVARQEFIGAPFSDLPEFNFGVADVVDVVDVEQDNVNQPSHYCSHPSGIECIEITRHHDFTIGNAIKYLWRAGLKDSADEIQDLEKASWYIQDKINQLKKLNDNP